MENASKKVLIVEDEEKIVEFIESYLINSGYEVLKAFSGSDALKLFYSQNCDLILLDLCYQILVVNIYVKKLEKRQRFLLLC